LEILVVLRKYLICHRMTVQKMVDTRINLLYHNKKYYKGYEEKSK